MDIELVPISELTPHARNFRAHPERQIAELQASLREYGWARNVVISSDNVILAGHGIVEAARRNGHTSIPVYRLGLRGDDPKAEKFLVLENTVSRLAEDDNEQLAALLADVQRTEGLDGTGYTADELDQLLAGLQAQEFAESAMGIGLPPEKLPNSGFHFALKGEEAAVAQEALDKAKLELKDVAALMLPTDLNSRAFLLICERYLR